ncbi:hypothetical protein MTP99_004097 [Tenebrio molitor]|nr:hypothetical protein MTP99_004097 [Tenebrio molitor]
MDYQHHNLLIEDHLKLVRVLGSDIFQTRIGKFLLKLTFIFYLALLVAQLYFFFLAASTANLIDHAPLFLQMCYAEFAITILLSRNQLVEQIMEVIDLWEIDSAGEETKQRITRESRRINIFVAINTILSVTWATTLVVSHNPTETVFVRHILHLLCPRQADFLLVFFNLTLYLAVFVMMAHAYEMIYTTQHVKFQMYMCKAFIQAMTDGTDSEETLMYDADYQQLTESRLKSLIKRHCDFIR